MNSCCVVGLGYIGLPTAALFSMKGYSVLGVDINLDIVNSVNKGVSPIGEPSLQDVIKKVVNSRQTLKLFKALLFRYLCNCSTNSYKKT